MIKNEILPLAGVRVLELGHAVMGPCCGMILADMGADVIKIEPGPDGDPTRSLKGFGTGYFGYFNRNKRSILLDLKTKEGRETAQKLVLDADVLIENFAPGTSARLGMDDETVRAINPRLIYASMKGFLPGPYQDRLALDEVVQMMSGLAYMTGPSGQPLRAGTSILDISGAMFAVIGILLALRQREKTGVGDRVDAALFETAVFLMGQHLCYQAQTDRDIPPMPERVSAWGVYDIFSLADGTSLFVGVTGDNQWRRLADALGSPAWMSDEHFARNADRVIHRPRMIPQLAGEFARLDRDVATELCAAAQIPYSLVAQPRDLFDDEHLKSTGGLLRTELPNGITTALPALPVRLSQFVSTVRRNPPSAGQHTEEITSELKVLTR